LSNNTSPSRPPRPGAGLEEYAAPEPTALHPASGHTSTNVTGTGHTSTATSIAGYTATSLAPLRAELTGTIVAPLEAGELPDVAAIKGLRLDQILLVTTGLLVVIVVGLLATVSTVTTNSQFEETSEIFNQRIQAQSQELGQTVSHTLALTSAASLRDNNYAFLGEVARSIIANNPNILRVQMYDAEGQMVADSDPEGKLGSTSERKAERHSTAALYKGKPVMEYQEPLDYGSSEGRGVVVLSYSTESLQAQLHEMELNQQATLRRNVTSSAVLGLGFVVLAGVLVAFQSRRITRPLGVLTGKVMQLAAGDLSARAEQPRSAGREVLTLGVVFNHMAERINVLLDDVRTKAQLERDVALARTVQETLLPGREGFQVGPLRIAGVCITADACGGDWWLRASLDERRVVVGIGDVTGHGLATALVATSATSGFAAALTMRHPDEVNAQLLITSLNLTLANIGRGEHQMSSALAMIDVKTGVIDYASGGHPSPLVINRTTRQIASLPSRGSLLGASINSQYASRQAQLQPGDIIVWYTDGLTETRDGRQKPYGTQGLAAALQNNAHLSVEALRDAILADVRAYSAGLPAQDDVTVVVAEYSPVSP
jgi:sigma-B regulation protein RsbU (phosphoserine phosphatase)